MARSTPTYTPPGKYVPRRNYFSSITDCRFKLSEPFTTARGLTQASGIHTQLILESIIGYTSKITATFKDKKDLTSY